MASTSTHNHKTDNNSAVVINPAPEDEYLSDCSQVSCQQVMRRRSYHLKQLANCYRDHYWGLMEELKLRYRDYMWKFGKSAFHEELKEKEKEKEEEKVVVKVEQVKVEIEDGNFESGNGNGSSGGVQCAFHGCNFKAMTLTSFCHLHILSDPKQQLYKPCEALNRDANGDVMCGKPVLRSIVPSLCCIHFQKAQQNVIRALRKAGLNVTSTNKVSPKLHVVVADYVRVIQEKRKRESRKMFVGEIEIEN